MKSSSSKIKVFSVILAIFLIAYISRHHIFSAIVERFLSEQFQYEKKVWEEGTLTYENISMGSELSASQLKFTPELKFSPFQISLEIYLREPAFTLTSEGPPSFNLALFAPTKWTHVKLDIERGSLSVDGEPAGTVDFLSGETPSQLGTLILSEEGNPYCTAILTTDLSYDLKLTSARALQLASFAKLFSISLPLQLQGGIIDAELRGSLGAIEGQVTATHLEFLTPQGEFDFQKLTLNGSYGQQLSLNSTIEGGRFSNGELTIDETYAKIVLQPNHLPKISARGKLFDRPFTCEAAGDEAIEGKLTLDGLPIPFLVSREENSFTLVAEFKDLPLIWLKPFAPFEEGRGAAIATLAFENEKLQSIALSNLLLQDVKIKELSCEVTSGHVVIEENQFLPSELSCTVNQIPGKITWKGPFVEIQGEVRAIAPLTLWTQNSFISEAPATLASVFQMKNHQVAWSGSFEAHSEKIVHQGAFDFNTEQWNITFTAPSITPAHYSPHVSEGSIQLSGTVNPNELILSCIGTSLTLQSESEILEIPGTTLPLQMKWMFDEQKLYAQMRLPDSILHLKTVAIPIHIKAGDLTWVRSGGRDEFLIQDMTGTFSLSQREVPFIASRLSGKENRYGFSIEVPDEEILLTGTLDGHEWTLQEAHASRSKIIAPLKISESGNFQGAALIDLQSMSHYVTLVQEAGFLLETDLPPMQGLLEIKGSLSQDSASLHLAGGEITIGDLTLPSIKGYVTRQNNHFMTDGLQVGEAYLTGHAIYENKMWRLPEWTAAWKELALRGSLQLKDNICALKTEGSWKETELQGQVAWNIKTQQGKDAKLSLQNGALKASLQSDILKYKEGKLESRDVETFLSHPQLKESIIARLIFSWTPERMTFQGPLTQGAYENDLFTLKGKEIHALYEKGVLQFQSKLELNEAPLKAKGYVNEIGKGSVKLQESENELQVAFETFTNITQIEGKLFGIEYSLKKKGTLYQGKLKIETSDPLATLLHKPDWKQFENLEFTGAVSADHFKGTVSGVDSMLQGYLIREIHANLDYTPTQFELKELKISDPAGEIVVKECKGERSHALKAWEITVPHLRGQHLQPSLLRKQDTPKTDPKPFQIRQLTLTQVSGIVGRPLTFKGIGSFYFTQKEKRDPSFFDLPRAFLKDWGLDVALLSPARGSATIELKQGKMVFSSLKETFSDGGHSEFYLADEPSYIDFSGSLFLNFRVKQNVALKLAEPFVLTVRGTWEKPLYTLR